MRVFRLQTVFICFAIAIATVSCVEPFDAETLEFESALVIDAKITNTFQKHTVLLRRTYPFEHQDFEVEPNATVQVNDVAGNSYEFQEVEAGKYESVSAFAAEPNMGYQLSITTSNGRSYQSETVMTPVNIPIMEVKGELAFDATGNEGIQISLVNEETNTDVKYLRHEYEETYKIVAPYYNTQEFDIIDSVFFGPGDFDTIEIGLKLRTEDARVCFNTLSSTDIALTDSEQNSNNQLTTNTIRFLQSDDFKISHRYSILVKQFALTQDAHSYYSSLDDFSSSESVFNEIQPGFLEGNIKAFADDEMVLGYFEVAAYDEVRYFFDYTDFFPDRPLPPYAINCDLTGAPLLIRFAPHVGPDFIADSGVLDSPLLEGIQAGVFAFFEVNEDYVDSGIPNDLESDDELGPYFVKATPCIDCRALGSTVEPDFWIE